MRVGTYAVVPMTPVLGVIEWVKHTMPIKVCGTGQPRQCACLVKRGWLGQCASLTMWRV
jgi:hypothetical protein